MGASTHGSRLHRLLELWKIYTWMDFLWVTRDLSSVVVIIVSDAIVSMTAASTTLLLAERFDGIGSWSKPQIIFMLGYSMLANGLLEMFFGFNIKFISRRLGRGQLDHSLVQPEPLWVTLLTEGFLPFSGSATLVTGLALLVWAGRRLALPVSAGWYGLLVLNIIASATILLAFQFCWGSLAFWAPRAAEEINSSTSHLMSQLQPFPLEGVGPFLLSGLVTVVPVGLLGWYPCRALLGISPRGAGVVVTPLAALGAALLAVWIFRKGLVHYGHTGSQRYLAFGFRR